MDGPAVELDRRLTAALDERRRQGLWRRTRALRDYDGAEATADDGRRVVVLCGNDYLGLAADPRPAEAAAASLRRGGAGAGAAHLVTGHRPEHAELEEALAAYTGREAALLFSTGYMANLGVVSALAGRGSVVAEDRLNHASLIDAVRLAGARGVRYRHADVEDLARRAGSAGEERGRRVEMVLTDGVFSMDGDLAPLPRLAEAAERIGAVLAVDDAHGLGVIGGGAGSVAATGCDPARVPVLVGTLGKGFGVFGAFVAGSRPLIDYLVQFARTYIYTTAPPPAWAAAATVAVRLAGEEAWRRERLESLVRRFRDGASASGLPLGDSQTPIQPVLLGSAERAQAWSEWLERAGLRVSAIRPPTVPEGGARLRVSFTALHTEEHVDRLLAALDEAAARFPVDGEPPG